jgi:methyltransferase
VLSLRERVIAGWLERAERLLSLHLLVLPLVFIPMLIEARLAARHEHAQRARGGIEPKRDVYAVMRFAYPAAFLVMLAEGLLRGSRTDSLIAVGALTFVGAKILKWWAIRSLGQSWTFRVIVVPGMRRVAHGPYRFVSHPNYIAVMGELVGVALMTGALITGPLAVVVFGALILRRVAVERRALDAILRGN